jgi:hypothetical protein
MWRWCNCVSRDLTGFEKPAATHGQDRGYKRL